jgi:hypothetical protein
VQRGDIDNELVPRLVLVFENLIGVVSGRPLSAQAFQTYVRTKRWKRAVSYLAVNDPLAKQMWHVTWHLGYQLEAVTYLHEDAVQPISDWIDRNDLPVHRVWYSEPNKLARKIATMPDLAAIFDPDPAHTLTFGRKGRIINPSAPDILRAW